MELYNSTKKCIPEYSMSGIDGLCFLDLEPCVNREGPCPICQLPSFLYKDTVIQDRWIKFGRFAGPGNIIIQDDDNTSTASEVVPFVIQRINEERNLDEPMALGGNM